VMEKTHVNLIIYLCLAAVNVVLDLLLIPRFGVGGAVLPVGVVMLLSVFIYRVVVGRYVNGLRVPARFIGKCFLASGATLLLVPFLRFIDDVPSLLAAVVVAVIVTGLGFKLVRVLGKEEIAMLEAVPIPAATRVLKFIAS
jgi:O-antigen/teichoic acid export membrane protein